MAIYSSVPPPEQQAPAVSVPLQAAPLIAELPIRRAGITLSIPLDAQDEAKSSLKPRKEPMRRDSLKRRDALLRGKEGSRRRQRWENDRLLHVPNAQPPLPSDWAPHPTYPVHTVPYYLAPLWDLRAEAALKPSKPTTSYPSEFGRVPQELKAKLKKSKGAKTLLQELELEVRTFVRDYTASAHSPSPEPELDSEDEEIVFIGRNGQMSDEARERVERVLEREKKVWDSAANDKGAGFGRWLVHSIAEYYGLESRSVTVGDPARREAYVGIREVRMRSGREVVVVEEMPRPLYGLV